MEFRYKGKKVKLRGATGKRLKPIQPDGVSKLMRIEGELSMMQLVRSLDWKPHLSCSLMDTNLPLHLTLQTLLDSYPTIFFPHLIAFPLHKMNLIIEFLLSLELMP